MSSTSTLSFHFEIEDAPDEHGHSLTTVTCHGRLTSETLGALKEAVLPLIEQGTNIVINCADVKFLDSAGLGALVGLKVSAIHQGSGTLKLVKVSPKVKDLLNLTKLDEFLSY